MNQGNFNAYRRIDGYIYKTLCMCACIREFFLKNIRLHLSKQKGDRYDSQNVWQSTTWTIFKNRATNQDMGFAEGSERSNGTFGTTHKSLL